MNVKLSKAVRSSIQKKLKGSKKIANTYVIAEGRYKPFTLLRFSKKNNQLFVSIFKRHKSGRRTVSKFLGKYNAKDLLSKKNLSKKKLSKRRSKRKYKKKKH